MNLNGPVQMLLFQSGVGVVVLGVVVVIATPIAGTRNFPLVVLLVLFHGTHDGHIPFQRHPNRPHRDWNFFRRKQPLETPKTTPGPVLVRTFHPQIPSGSLLSSMGGGGRRRDGGG